MSDKNNDHIEVITSEGRPPRTFSILGLLLFSLGGFLISGVEAYFFGWPALQVALLMTVVVVAFFSIRLGYSLAQMLFIFPLICCLNIAAVWVGVTVASPAQPQKALVKQTAQDYYWQSSTNNGLFLRSNFDVGNYLQISKAPPPGSAWIINSQAASSDVQARLPNSSLACGWGKKGQVYSAPVSFTKGRDSSLSVIPAARPVKLPGSYPANQGWCAFIDNRGQFALVTLSDKPIAGSGGITSKALNDQAKKQLDAYANGNNQP